MFHYLIIMNVEVKRKLVYGCLLIMVAVGMMSFSYDMTGEQEANVQEDKVVAFPGAEGHGRYTTGGRGGKVYHVTSLEDDGSHGTLRWALKQNGPKTIVFDVAGTIRLKSELRTGRDNLTIAGQTSPGGICLADYGFSINSNNVIIRFLRFRPGEASGKEPDGLGGCDKKDIMVYDSLQQILKQLPDDFYQCHRSFIINFNHVKRIEKEYVVMDNGEHVSVSRLKRKELSDLFFKYMGEKM